MFGIQCAKVCEFLRQMVQGTRISRLGENLRTEGAETERIVLG